MESYGILLSFQELLQVHSQVRPGLQSHEAGAEDGGRLRDAPDHILRIPHLQQRPNQSSPVYHPGLFRPRGQQLHCHPGGGRQGRDRGSGGDKERPHGGRQRLLLLSTPGELILSPGRSLDRLRALVSSPRGQPRRHLKDVQAGHEGRRGPLGDGAIVQGLP